MAMVMDISSALSLVYPELAGLSLEDVSRKHGNDTEILEWLSFARTCNEESSIESKLAHVNSCLSTRTVLAGQGMTIGIADVTVFMALHSAVISLSSEDQGKFPNLIRWFDYIQNKVDVTQAFPKLSIKKPEFKALVSEDYKAIETAPEVKLKLEKILRALESGKKSASDEKEKIKVKKEKEVKGAAQKKEKEEKAPAQKKDTEVSISVLDIRVGVVKKVWKHPSADSLLVEEIDLGECGIRQVVSGLAKFISEEDMLNRKVLVIVNVKPGKLRDVMSAGLVLCASNDDHTLVEPVMPPLEAVPGEKVAFAGHDGKPEDVLNPKKKQLEKVFPDLVTDSAGVAMYKGIPFMTSVGPCKSSLCNAAVR